MEASLLSAYLKNQVSSSVEMIHNQYHTMLLSGREVTGLVLWFLLITLRPVLHLQVFILDNSLVYLLYVPHLFLKLRRKESQVEVLGENDGQVTLLISLFTLLNVLLKLLFFGILPISSHLLNNNLLSVCKHYAEE